MRQRASTTASTGSDGSDKPSALSNAATRQPFTTDQKGLLSSTFSKVADFLFTGFSLSTSGEAIWNNMRQQQRTPAMKRDQSGRFQAKEQQYLHDDLQSSKHLLRLRQSAATSKSSKGGRSEDVAYVVIASPQEASALSTTRTTRATTEAKRDQKRKRESEDIGYPPVAKKSKTETQAGGTKDSKLDPVHLILEDLPQHTDSFRELSKDLYARSWHLISDVPSEIQDLGLNWPILIPASRCWKSGASPPVKEVFAYCTDKVHPDNATIDGTTYDLESRTLGNVLFQLVAPPDELPLVAHNIPLEGELPELDETAITEPFNIPAGLIDYCMNVTPKNTVVDIHIDQGTNGLSIPIGLPSDPVEARKLHAHKIWFLWPPTAHNLRIYGNLKATKKQCLPRSQGLEHGIIASTGIGEGIFLPAGWLHAVITTQSGFLAGITFNSPASITQSSQMMAIDTRLEVSRFSEFAPLYTAALDLALSSGDRKAFRHAVEGWMWVERSLSMSKLNPNAGANRTECRKILNVWKGVMESKKEFNLLDRKMCACGWKGKPTAYGEHFWKRHLSVIMVERYRGPFK